MFAILPALEILKAATDQNIQSQGAQIRVDAFHKANYLQSLTEIDADIVIEGNMFERIKPRLTEDQKVFFETAYRIDNSTSQIPQYDVRQALKWSAKNEANLRKVLIVAENVSDYTNDEEIKKSKRIQVIRPAEFVEKTKKLKQLVDEQRKILKDSDLLSAYIARAINTIFFNQC